MQFEFQWLVCNSIPPQMLSIIWVTRKQTQLGSDDRFIKKNELLLKKSLYSLISIFVINYFKQTSISYKHILKGIHTATLHLWGLFWHDDLQGVFKVSFFPSFFVYNNCGIVTVAIPTQINVQVWYFLFSFFLSYDFEINKNLRTTQNYINNRHPPPSLRLFLQGTTIMLYTMTASYSRCPLPGIDSKSCHV